VVYLLRRRRIFHGGKGGGGKKSAELADLSETSLRGKRHRKSGYYPSAGEKKIQCFFERGKKSGFECLGRKRTVGAGGGGGKGTMRSSVRGKGKKSSNLLAWEEEKDLKSLPFGEGGSSMGNERYFEEEGGCGRPSRTATELGGGGGCCANV